MVNYLLVSLIVVLVTVQNFFKKVAEKKASNFVFSFATGSTLAALLVFLFTSGGKFEFSFEYLKYSFAFATAYSTTLISTIYALLIGPLALTSLISSFSLILPAIYSILFLNEEISFLLIVGLMLLAVSLVLINFEKKGEEKKITFKWVLMCAIGFFGNGFCSIFQKLQQIEFSGKFKSEFMIIAFMICVIIFFIVTLITEKKIWLHNFKKCFVYYFPCGIANGVVNYLVIFLSLRMAASIMFPIISAGGNVLTFAIALLFFKEKLSVPQSIGLIIGTVAAVILNF